MEVADRTDAAIRSAHRPANPSSGEAAPSSAAGRTRPRSAALRVFLCIPPAASATISTVSSPTRLRLSTVTMLVSPGSRTLFPWWNSGGLPLTAPKPFHSDKTLPLVKEHTSRGLTQGGGEERDPKQGRLSNGRPTTNTSPAAACPERSTEPRGNHRGRSERSRGDAGAAITCLSRHFRLHSLLGFCLNAISIPD